MSVNWCDNIELAQIKDIQVVIDDDMRYDSSKNKNEKIKLLLEIDKLKNLGIKYCENICLNDPYEKIKFCYEMMKFEYNKLLS